MNLDSQNWKWRRLYYLVFQPGQDGGLDTKMTVVSQRSGYIYDIFVYRININSDEVFLRMTYTGFWVMKRRELRSVLKRIRIHLCLRF